MISKYSNYVRQINQNLHGVHSKEDDNDTFYECGARFTDVSQVMSTLELAGKEKINDISEEVRWLVRSFYDRSRMRDRVRRQPHERYAV